MRNDAAKSDAAEALAFLAALDPTFAAEWESNEHTDDDLTLHHIVRVLACHLGARHSSLSEKQLRKLAEWLNASVAAGGERENAVSTCLLEHLHQLKLSRVLGPYLSPIAKERTHA
jgi:hypothetical protein